MLPSEELLQSIDILAQNAVKDSVKIYTAIVTSVADDGTCSVKVNGKTHSGVAYYGATPSVNKSYRVFCPNGSMNQAFIITGGSGGSLPIASADTLGGIKVGAGLSITSQGTLSATGGGTADAVEWSNVLDKPTTIRGYGITDAKIDGNDIVLGSNTITPYSANNVPPYPVTSINGQTGNVVIPTGGNVDSVNGKTGTVVLTALDVGALPNTTEIPSKTSELENDSGYITNSALSGYARTSDIPTKTSQLQNNSGFITANDAPVQSVDGATGNVVTNAVKTTTQTLTASQKQQARMNIGAGTSSFDGDYNSLANKPTIPTKTSDITNDSGYITETDIPVKSVNGKTGVVALDAESVGALPDTTSIPNKTSDLTNDSGYITSTALEPYAKTADLPTKTSQLDNDSGYITNAALDGYAKETDIPTNNNQLTNGAGYITAAQAPVQSVNGKTGVVSLSASDVGALPDSTVIPSKTSQLDNDSGFITDIPIASSIQLGGVKVGAGLSVTANGVLSATGGGTADAVEWDNVLDTPTTIDGYGITDAKIENGTITLGDKTITPLTEAPVTSVNSKTGVVVLTAPDVDAISTGDITQTLGTSTTKVPSEKAVSDALSAAGAGDMLKSTYDPDGTVATAGGIPDYVEANGGKIDTIKVNGEIQTVTDKTVNITVPTKTSDLNNDSGYITESPVSSVNGKTGAVELTSDDVGALSKPETMTANKWFKTDANSMVTLSDLPNASTGSKGITYLVNAYNRTDTDKAVTAKALNDVYKLIPKNYVSSVNGSTGDVETQYIFGFMLTDSSTEGEPLCQSGVDAQTIIQAYQENKQVIGQSVNTSYLGQFELLSCPSYAGDGNEFVFIGALSNADNGLNPQIYTLKFMPSSDSDYIEANAVPFKVDLPDNLVKYQSLSTVQATSKVDADTLQGHNAAYFATASALSTTNSNVATNTSNISTLQSGLSTANTNIDNKVSKSGGTMTGALVAQTNTNYTTRQVRNVIISTADPSGGSSGDLWLKYSN